MVQPTTLGEFIVENQKDFPFATGDLSHLLTSIRLAAKVVNREINKAGLADILGAMGQDNIQGEAQQKLDVMANDTFMRALRSMGQVCGVGSEEEEHYISFDDDIHREAKYVVLMDPLDGSSNIDVNVSVGTIFSIYRRITPTGTPVTLEDFLATRRCPSRSRICRLWLFHYARLHYRKRCERLLRWIHRLACFACRTGTCRFQNRATSTV